MENPPREARFLIVTLRSMVQRLTSYGSSPTEYLTQTCRLASGCCLLLAGSIADLVGNRIINLIGTVGLGVFFLACGLARTGIQLIIFRTLQGVAVAMCFPTSVSILTEAFPSGKRRNIGFSCLGLGQPFGASVGLVLAGVFENTPTGWRLGFYICGGAALILACVNYLYLPRDRPRQPLSRTRLVRELDWIGVALSSTGFGLLSYVFA